MVKGPEQQAVSGSGQAGVNNPERWGQVQNDRQSQGQGRQNGENPGRIRKQEQETGRSRGTNAGRFHKQKKVATDKQRTQV